MFGSNSQNFEAQRKQAVKRIEEYLGIGKRMKEALLKIEREKFVPSRYRSSTYSWNKALPIPGKQATISAINTYPLFYEPLELEEGDEFLEVGAGSGYGAALAKEIVGKEGKVYTIEIDEETFEFAKKNLEEAGYPSIKLLRRDGSKGYPEGAPYSKISITASTSQVPETLIEQLKVGGKLAIPLGIGWRQNLVLLEKTKEGLKKKSLHPVRYVPLQEE